MATLAAVAMAAFAASLGHKPGCHPPIVDAAWSPLWRLSFHPVAPNVSSQGDSCGGLHVNGTWHVMTSCGGGWTHLTTTDLVHYTNHAQIALAGGTGSVVPSPDGNGVIGFINSISKRVVSTDGMRTWAAAKTTTVGSPGGRDQARPLQSADGTWFQMMGCGQDAKDGAVCRFRATDPLRLSAWAFDGYLWQSNHTVFGAKFDFCEVPDFYPLTTKAGVTKHVLVVDPWGSNQWNHSSAIQPLPTPPASYDPHVHNVQWITGTWSRGGKKFEPEKQGCLDYGWWYAARSTADSSNTGRRLMYGNIGSDVVRSPVNPWPNHEAHGLRFFNSLPRDVSLAADGQTVHVRPPPELKGLRASASPTATAAAERLECGKHKVLSAELRAAEFVVMVNISQLRDAGATVGMFVLASAGLEEAVYVGVNSTSVFVDTRKSSLNKTMFDEGFRLQTVLLAPFSRPASGVLQLHVWLDETVVEVFASDCVCSSADMSSCDCDGHSKTAVAVTALAFAGGSGHGAATTSGLFATCAGGGSAGATAGGSVWALNAAPVKQAIKSDDGDAGLPWPLRHAAARPPTTARTLNVRALGAKSDNATYNSDVCAGALKTLLDVNLKSDDVVALAPKPAPQGVCNYTIGGVRDICNGEVIRDPTHVPDDGRKVAWLPPPDHNNHASFLHELPDGSLGLVFFSGTEEQEFNCSIYFSKLDLPGGSTQWSPTLLISRRFDWSNENPNLMTDPETGYLIAHHSSQPARNCVGDPTNSGHIGKPCCPSHTLVSPGPGSSCEHYAEVWRVVSRDQGATWGRPHRWLGTPSSFSRNRPIQVAGGEWLFPMFYAQGSFSPKNDSECEAWPTADADYAGLWRSPPRDPLSFHWTEHTWQDEKGNVRSGFPGSGCRVHPSIVDLGGGHLKVFFRSRRMDFIYTADSYDNGKTWTLARKTKLPNNNASIQVNKLLNSTFNASASDAGQSLVLVFDNTNRTCDFKDCTKRMPLSIALSYDGGVMWPFVRDLEYLNHYPEQPGDPDPGRTEYSYPSVLQSKVDQLLHISHSYNRDTIKYQAVSEEWVMRGSTVGLFKGDNQMKKHLKSEDADASKSKPNVIFCLVDDWGYNDVGYHNAQNENIIRTPNMDRLSSSMHGIRLEKFYSQPICTPTRSQTLTGRMQIHTGLQHGVLWSTQPNGLPLNETTVAEHLDKLGYSTHAIGKWHVGHSNLSMTPLRRGFDSFFGFWGGSEDHWSHHSGPLDFRDGEAVARNFSSTDQSNASYSTHLFSQRAVDIVEAHADNKAPPFFIYLAYQATHAPLQAPLDVVASFGHVKDASRRTFAAMAAVVDEGLGNITSALISSGNNNTVLLVSGDNGGPVGTGHGGSNFPLRGWKGSLWEGGARASAFVWSPLLPPRANFVWRGLSHVSDWLPTALELAGVADPKKQFPALDGFPLWAALTSGGRSPRTELLHEIDRIAEPRFSCSGPIAPTDGNGTGGWSLPSVEDRYVRAAIHSIINGTSFKLVIGECAGWDTSSQVVPPPNYAAPPPPPLPVHCKAGSVPNRSTFVHPLIDGTWLFNVDADESERCDLSAAEPELLKEMMSRLEKYAATEVPVRYPAGSPKLDPGRCVPPLDYWFASDEPGLLQRCTGRMPPPPPPPAPPGHPGAPVRFEAGNDTSSCLVAPAAGAQSWLQVGSCAGKHAEWRRIDGPQLESMAFPGQCLNVYGGPPACCPGGANENRTKFHLVTCAARPGNAFHSEQFHSETYRNIVLADVSKWRACGNLCVAPSAPLVTLQPCSAGTTWKRVNVTDVNRSLKSDDTGQSWTVRKSHFPANLSGSFGEPTVSETQSGDVLLNTRIGNDAAASGGTHCLFAALSTDGGASFSAAAPVPKLVSPGCQGSVMLHPPSGRILFSGPSSGHGRVNGKLVYSEHNGAPDSWRAPTRLPTAASRCCRPAPAA